MMCTEQIYKFRPSTANVLESTSRGAFYRIEQSTSSLDWKENTHALKY